MLLADFSSSVSGGIPYGFTVIVFMPFKLLKTKSVALVLLWLTHVLQYGSFVWTPFCMMWSSSMFPFQVGSLVREFRSSVSMTDSHLSIFGLLFLIVILFPVVEIENRCVRLRLCWSWFWLRGRYFLRLCLHKGSTMNSVDFISPLDRPISPWVDRTWK
jgi:hypothetical protein